MKPNLYPIKVFLFRSVAGVMWNSPWLVLEDGGVGPAAGCSKSPAADMMGHKNMGEATKTGKLPVP